MLETLGRSPQTAALTISQGGGSPSYYSALAATDEWRTALISGSADLRCLPPPPASKPAADFGQSVASLFPRLARFAEVYKADGDYRLPDDPVLEDLVLQAPDFASVLHQSLLDRSGNIVTPLLAIAAHEKAGTRITYLQGVPGAGKAFTMAIFAVLIGICSGAKCFGQLPAMPP